ANSEDEMKERMQNEATPFTRCIIPMSKGHNESVNKSSGGGRFVAGTAECREGNRRKGEKAPPLPEPPKESLQILFFPPPWKPLDAESRVVTPPPPPKPSESFESHVATVTPPPKPPDDSPPITVGTAFA
ncbi:hypothetical protein L195_g048183, partial [Trifolium pratense]